MGINGTQRLERSQMQLDRGSASEEHNRLKALEDNKKKGAQSKIPLKAGASEHNHSN